MAFTVYARMKKLGKESRKDLPASPFALERRPKTLRELLTGLAMRLAEDYNGRKDSGQLLPFLTQGEIRSQAAAGKVSFGVHGGAYASAQEAAEVAVACFEGGMYRVFCGEEELTELDGAIDVAEGAAFTFIRLTMLTGW